MRDGSDGGIRRQPRVCMFVRSAKQHAGTHMTDCCSCKAMPSASHEIFPGCLRVRPSCVKRRSWISRRPGAEADLS